MSGLPILNPEQELLQALDRLWTPFGKGKGDRRWSDMSEEMARAAETKGIRELTDAEYHHLSWHALCWAYSEKHTIQYFLPRLAADMSQGTLRDVHPAMVIRSLIACHWQTWPDPERSAIDGWLHAWWRTCLATHPVVYRPANVDYRWCSRVLELICLAGLDPTPFLHDLGQVHTPEADAQLADLAGEVVTGLHGSDELWKEVWGRELSVDDHLSATVIAWLSAPQQIARLRQYAADREASEQEEAWWNADYLEQHASR